VQFRNKHYPELNPSGTAVVFATYFCDIAPWRELNEGQEQVTRSRRGEATHTLAVKRGPKYGLAKKEAAQLMIDVLNRRYPGLADAIVLRDISTPLTQVRYTQNYNGTVLQWQPFVEGGETLETEINRLGPVLPGLENFYMSGVWVTTGGLIRAAVAGRHVMQFVCRDDKKPFTAHIDDSAPEPTHVFIPEGAIYARNLSKGDPVAAGARGTAAATHPPAARDL